MKNLWLGWVAETKRISFVIVFAWLGVIKIH